MFSRSDSTCPTSTLPYAANGLRSLQVGSVSLLDYQLSSGLMVGRKSDEIGAYGSATGITSGSTFMAGLALCTGLSQIKICW